MTAEHNQRDPVQAAAVLSKALAENTNALRRANRRSVGALIAALLACAAILFTGVERYQSRVEGCERDNRLRQANIDLWAPVLAANPPKHPGPGASEGEVKEYEKDLAVYNSFKATLETGFALRDCGDIGWIG